jgi:hypothetical protein
VLNGNSLFKRSDIRRTLKNALVYNEPRSAIYDMARVVTVLCVHIRNLLFAFILRALCVTFVRWRRSLLKNEFAQALILLSAFEREWSRLVHAYAQPESGAHCLSAERAFCFRIAGKQTGKCCVVCLTVDAHADPWQAKRVKTETVNTRRHMQEKSCLKRA